MKRIVVTATAMALFCLCSFSPAYAGWKFWGSDKAKDKESQQVVRTVVFKVSDDASEKELLTFLRSREFVSRDVVVLDRISRAKQAQFADIQEKLQGLYGIEPAKQYEYDADTMTVYEAKTDKTEKKEFKKWTDKADGTRFLEMISLKRRLDTDIVVLQRIEKEQTENLVEIHNALLRRYGVRRDRRYEYDKKKRILYEVSSGVAESQVSMPSTDSADERDEKEERE